MIPELAHFLCVTAFCCAVALTLTGSVGARRVQPKWVDIAKQLAIVQFLLLALSTGLLDWAFLSDDFSVKYVSDNSNEALPWYFKASALWGDHEGSFLLWTLVAAGWTAAVALYGRQLSIDMHGYVLGIMGFLNSLFLLFLLVASNPFERNFPLDAVAGRDMNAILQDIGHLIHPPFLYLGYVGFSVAFAFAIAALLTGRLDAAWARWSRPWTNVSWAFLTIGIALGSWWAYYELGWGGWWFWDPVENASFMPWLAATALIHSLSVTEKRGAFKSWTVLLAILTFTLCLIGAFLVRSGVLTSVHAFAIDPGRGMFLAAILVIVSVSAMILYSFRANTIRSQISYQGLSRELLLLSNNALLTIALAVIFLYTLYPLFYEWFTGGERVSIGPPYFNRFFVPIMVTLTAGLAIAPIVRWKRTKLARLKPASYMLLGSLALGLVIPLFYDGLLHLGASLCLGLAIWVIVTHVSELLKSRRRPQLGFLGMSVAHIGFAVTVIGITITSGFSITKDLRLAIGDSVEVNGRYYEFTHLERIEGPNYIADRGTFTVGDVVLYPERRQYRATSTITTEAAIRPGFTNDLFIALSEQLDGGYWAVRIQEKPLIRWIWLGALLIAIAGVVAVMDRRYRKLRIRDLSASRHLDLAPQGS